MDASQTVLLSNTLDPLPETLRRGLVVVAACGLLSLMTSSILFLCLSYRLFAWHYRGQMPGGPNQFIILIYNLLIADIQQGTAFASTVIYVYKNKIEVGSMTCDLNAFFISTGDLASSVFIFGIALHTYFAIVKGKTLPDSYFYICLWVAWIFVYAMAAVTTTMSSHVYVRAGAWCWIDRKYDHARLWLHYFWIFLCMAGTIIVYCLTYISLHTDLASRSQDSRGFKATRRMAQCMIVLPIIYVFCTLPLAGGRMAAMTGIRIPYWYYCLAGSAIGSCGWLDVVFYVLTRHHMIFGKDPPSKTSVGMHSFGWYQGSKFYGTVTTVEGPLTTGRGRSRHGLSRSMAEAISQSAWLPWKKEKRPDEEEGYFASISEGVITTKVTIEVTSGPVMECCTNDKNGIEADSDTSSIEIDPKVYPC